MTKEAVASSILSVHNIAYQLNLMRDIRKAIEEDRYPAFIRNFMREMYTDRDVPQWIRDALKSVNVDLEE